MRSQATKSQNKEQQKGQPRKADLKTSSINLSMIDSLVDSSNGANRNRKFDGLQQEINPKDGQINTVMEELEQLSQSFVSSYQTLEGHVQSLNGQLKSVTDEKHDVVRENELLLAEKSALASRLQNLLAILPSGVVVLDNKGSISECNAVAVDLLGRPLLGEKWLDIIQRSFSPQADDGHEVSLKDGRKIHIETRALDAEPGQLIVLTDLTKTRALQAELSRQQKLQSMGKMVASLAHQIRTPLAAALLYASHLNGKSISQETRYEFSHQLTERLHYMERQINDMLAFVRGERKQKSRIDIVELFEQIRQQSRNLKVPVKCVFESASRKSYQMLGDIDGLRGALMNLIENAIAATATTTKRVPDIRLEFSLTDQLTIRVKDNGCGISEADKVKIFEAFYTSKRQGNGLGLAIVKGVVINHQGSISLVSDIDKGSCFTLCFPITVNQVNGVDNATMGDDE